jgi:aryl-alcohol dehydrogenase-like predicted oxidoreductase
MGNACASSTEVKSMKTSPIGRGGVSVSSVGLGGFELGPYSGEEPDVSRAAAVIDAALESGVNWLDTSENYLDTHNETLIGAALAQSRDEVVVASKVAPSGGGSGGGSGFRRDQVHAACRASLRRLGREQIDIYFLHWPDKTGVPLEETWGAMAELVEDGLVRAIGLSNYSIEDVERCHAQRPVDAVQDGLNLIDYLDNRAAFTRYGELGIAVTLFDVLSSGILTERTREQVLAAWETFTVMGFRHPLLAPDKVDRSLAVADGLRPIAERLGATVAQVAIAWVLHQPGVTAALAGTRSPSRARENADAARLDLTGSLEEIEELITLGPAFARDDQSQS